VKADIPSADFQGCNGWVLLNKSYLKLFGRFVSIPMAIGAMIRISCDAAASGWRIPPGGRVCGIVQLSLGVSHLYGHFGLVGHDVSWVKP